MVKRKYTISRRPGCDVDRDTPYIRISGKWLSKIGFNVGDHIELAVYDKMIIVSPATDEDIPDMIEEVFGTEAPETRFPSRMKVSDIIDSFLPKS